METYHLLRRKVAVCFVAVLAAGCRPAPPEHARSLVLVSIDTLRADMLGAYGYERPTSPTLDALAESGVLFETAVSTSPWTLPAHASLLTGLYPSRHGLKSLDVALPDEVATLAEILAERGFATAAFVSSHHLTQRYGLSRGFQEFTYSVEDRDYAGPSAVAEAASDWLSREDHSRFFLFVHHYGVHSDYRSLPVYEEQFLHPYDGAVDGSTEQLREFRKGNFALDRRDVSNLIDRYVAGIRQMDDDVARIVRALEEKNRLDETLLVLTSDHGEEFLEHGGVLHGRTQYDELLRVPLILRGPGVPAGARLDEPVSLVDVAPTVLSLLGVRAPGIVDGLDLSLRWRADPPGGPTDRFLFGEADHGNPENDVTRSVRLGGYKMILDRSTGETALYDLDADPRETRDVRGEHRKLAALLRAELEEFMRSEMVGAARDPHGELAPEEAEKLRALGYLWPEPASRQPSSVSKAAPIR